MIDNELVARWQAVYRERLQGAVPEERILVMAQTAALRGDVPPPLRSVPPSITVTDIRHAAEDMFGLSYMDELRLFLAWGVVKGKVAPVVIPAIKAFFWDPTVFVRLTRAFLAWFSIELGRGDVPWANGPRAWWVSPLVMALAFMFGAGDKTPSNVKELSDRMPATLPEGSVPVVPASQSVEGGTPVEKPPVGG